MFRNAGPSISPFCEKASTHAAASRLFILTTDGRKAYVHMTMNFHHWVDFCKNLYIARNMQSKQ